MKLLQIKANGLPLFKQELNLLFFSQQRVSKEDSNNLHKIGHNLFLNTTNAFIGINASGKTSVLNVIHLALGMLSNKPINHLSSRLILGCAEKVIFSICFINNNKVCLLETEIKGIQDKTKDITYLITDESFYEKPLSSVKNKMLLTDFSSYKAIATRSAKELFLPDDVSFIIAHNKTNNDQLDYCSLLSYNNMNILPAFEDVSLDVISFLDSSVENLWFDKEGTKQIIHLKFYNQDEIILFNTIELENYLSSGTIKGIITFSMARDILNSGGCLLIDEIENHFNKEIVMTLIRLFTDCETNKKGSVLMFSTHYPEILDQYSRNDPINIVRNKNGITVENLCNILKRNDIKKSDAYQSNLIDGTAPSYEAYMKLKKSLL